MKKQTKQSRKILPSTIYFLFVLVLGMVIIFETVSLINILSIKQKIPTSTTSLSPASYQPEIQPEKTKRGLIKIVLEENQKIIPKKNLKAKIIFNSYEEPVGGVDLILTFNPNLISFVDVVGDKDSFEQIIVNIQKQEEGEIKITAYQPKQVLKGEKNLAFLTFKLLENHPTSIKIKFLGPGIVTDSNLVSQITQKDILEEVRDLDLNL